MNPTSSTASLQCTSIGSAAQQILHQTRSLQVVGTTSRGAFLQCSNRKIVFLSTERFRGPLTLNLDHQDAPKLARLTPETAGERAPEGLLFSQVKLQIDLRQAQVWCPEPPLAAHPSPRPGFAIQAYHRKPERGFAPIIPALLSRQAKGQHPREEAVLAIRAALHEARWQQIPALAVPLIGYGGGLTPSGDDFLLGLMLALHRWGNVLGLRGDLENLQEELIQMIQARSTAISAGLIACAGDGLADERLIHALDALMGTRTATEKTLDDLLGWGNSSGLDALTGMLVTLPLAP